MPGKLVYHSLRNYKWMRAELFAEFGQEKFELLEFGAGKGLGYKERPRPARYKGTTKFCKNAVYGRNRGILLICTDFLNTQDYPLNQDAIIIRRADRFPPYTTIQKIKTALSPTGVAIITVLKDNDSEYIHQVREAFTHVFITDKNIGVENITMIKMSNN